MSEIKSLWGEIPTSTDLPDLPNKILKEQGAWLTEATDGSLIGETMLSNSQKQNFAATLRIKVPSLNSYVYNVVQISYPINIYPVTVSNLTETKSKVVCKDVEEYKQTLKQILSSDKVKAVITALLAQVSAQAVVEV
ncbi:MAG: hypothetical protein AAFP09_11340 [Cyanobacteria bacterium J06607_10]